MFSFINRVRRSRLLIYQSIVSEQLKTMKPNRSKRLNDIVHFERHTVRLRPTWPVTRYTSRILNPTRISFESISVSHYHHTSYRFNVMCQNDSRVSGERPPRPGHPRLERKKKQLSPLIYRYWSLLRRIRKLSNITARAAANAGNALFPNSIGRAIVGMCVSARVVSK